MLHHIMEQQEAAPSSSMSTAGASFQPAELQSLSDTKFINHTACAVLNTFGSKKAKKLLPVDYEPSSYTVLVGRSRDCQEHVGNKRLRVIVSSHLQEYNAAADKIGKTAIVSKVYDAIRAANPLGHFVKLLFNFKI